MGNSLQNIAACCTSRDDEVRQYESFLKHRHETWQEVPETDEFLAFFDCYETDEDLLCKPDEENPEGPIQMVRVHSGNSSSLPRKVPVLRRSVSHDADEHASLVAALVENAAGNRALNLVPEEAARAKFQSCELSSSFPLVAGDTRALLPEDIFEDLVPIVKEAVLAEWRQRLKTDALDDKLRENLKEGFPELEEWTTLVTVRRMLRASNGIKEQSIRMLSKAIECRLREREMFTTMRCKVVCDMRIIGRDLRDRPTIYMCARSQKEDLTSMIPQIFLAFEAAAKLAPADGQAILVADMKGLQPRLNMQAFAFKHLAENFGVVYADRLNFILIVDFSFIAQAVWSVAKTFLTERTTKKINFVNEVKARGIVQERFPPATSERILSAFDINRDPVSTDQERELHARRTSICDVPLGSLRPADEAG